MSIEHYWDQLSGTTYPAGTKILWNACSYDSTKGLKDTSTFYKNNTSTNTWVTDRTETYGYDSSLDYLTSANYGDGLANATPAWTYDAAGNRISDSTNTGTWTYDNLNRMTVSPGKTYTNDVLGNRTGRGSPTVAYYWDCLNRMTGYGAIGYEYRADGLRVAKIQGEDAGTNYRYDGQMGIEDEDVSSGAVSAYTRYGLGARGIDYMEKVTSSSTVVAYPIYDAHGNMVATLQRSGTNSYTFGDQRSYDAWGKIRSGSGTGDPKGTYCANLGHKQDDESGLIYMRARYYEPAAGRYISEDRAGQGLNWFCYCGNNPVTRSDQSGGDYDVIELLQKAWTIFCDSHWGSGTLGTRQKLLGIIDALKDASKAARTDGLRLISEAEADEDVQSATGSAGDMQAQIDDIKMSLGVGRIGTGAAAQLAIGVIKIMLELLKDDMGDPEEWFGPGG